MSENFVAFVVCMHLRFYQGTFKILSLHLGAFMILSFHLTFSSLHMMCIEVTVFALHPLGFCELYGSVIRCPLVIPYLFPCFFCLLVSLPSFWSGTYTWVLSCLFFQSSGCSVLLLFFPRKNNVKE